jgi:hypothetical protein
MLACSRVFVASWESGFDPTNLDWFGENAMCCETHPTAVVGGVCVVNSRIALAADRP